MNPNMLQSWVNVGVSSSSQSMGSTSTEVPLHLYPNIYTSGSVPRDWKSIKGGSIKYPVRNPAVRRYLQQILAGKWQKVIKKGSNGEVHYFEHASGQVAGVKFLSNQSTP